MPRCTCPSSSATGAVCLLAMPAGLTISTTSTSTTTPASMREGPHLRPRASSHASPVICPALLPAGAAACWITSNRLARPRRASGPGTGRLPLALASHASPSARPVSAAAGTSFISHAVVHCRRCLLPVQCPASEALPNLTALAHLEPCMCHSHKGAWQRTDIHLMTYSTVCSVWLLGGVVARRCGVVANRCGC
jgi:hypothetical protein